MAFRNLHMKRGKNMLQVKYTVKRDIIKINTFQLNRKCRAEKRKYLTLS